MREDPISFYMGAADRRYAEVIKYTRKLGQINSQDIGKVLCNYIWSTLREGDDCYQQCDNRDQASLQKMREKAHHCALQAEENIRELKPIFETQSLSQ